VQSNELWISLDLSREYNMKGIDTITTGKFQYMTGKYACKIKGYYTTCTEETKEQHLSSTTKATDLGTMAALKNCKTIIRKTVKCLLKT